MLKKRSNKNYQTNANWAIFNNQYKAVEIERLHSYLLSCTMNPEARTYLNTLAKASKQEYCIQIMSLPEYQMC